MVCSEGLSSRQTQAKSGLAWWMIVMAGCPRGATTKELESLPITTQQIPESLAPWGEKQEKSDFAMQSAGETGHSWGNGFRTWFGAFNLERTYEQSNRLKPARPALTDGAVPATFRRHVATV